MSMLEKGQTLKTCAGVSFTVGKPLGEGGQGEVYCIDYQGEKKALKWYKPEALRKPDLFYENLKKITAKGSPDKAFLWPQAVTEKVGGTFGYIMDIRPDGYYDLSKILASPTCNFASFVAATQACIKIVSAFRILHNNGYSYQDLNDGTFFINPKNGDVLICDNDNVAPNGTHTGILGKPRYMAPEIVNGNGSVLPDTQSDLYSLAAILFLILFCNHPLEGKRWISAPCFTDQLADKLYGKDPLFIFDPSNNANAPVRNIQRTVIERWSYMPSYLKEQFLVAFSQDALKNPQKRLIEIYWLQALVRFRSEIVKCACGNEVFIQNASTTACDVCGRPVPILHTIKLPSYVMAAARGSRIYRCQLGTCNADDALSPVAGVVCKPDNPNILGLKNMTSMILPATTPSGKQKQVQPKEVIPFKAGIVVEAYDKQIRMQ